MKKPKEKKPAKAKTETPEKTAAEPSAALPAVTRARRRVEASRQAALKRAVFRSDE